MIKKGKYKDFRQKDISSAISYLSAQVAKLTYNNAYELSQPDYDSCCDIEHTLLRILNGLQEEQ